MKRYLLILSILIFSQQTSFTQSLEELGTKLDIRSVAITGKNILIGTWGNGIYLSPDSGYTWKPLQNGLSDQAKIFKVVFIGKNMLAFDFENGIYLSTNNGTKWNNVQTFGKASGLEKFKNKAYVASEKGLFVSDNGLTWTNANLAKTPVLDLSANSDFIVIGQQNSSRQYFSSSDGETWKLTSGMAGSGSLVQHGNFITSLRFKNTNKKIDAASTCIIYEGFILNASGKKWDKISVPMSRYYDFDKNNIYSISAYLDQTKDNKYFFHTDILLSTDRGKKWKKIGLDDPLITSNGVLKYKLIQYESEAEKELVAANTDRLATEKMNQEWIELKKKLREWSPDLSAAINVPTNYQELSNDRFNEMHSYRESYIDNHGKLHFQ